MKGAFMLRDYAGRFTRSTIVRKLSKWVLIGCVVWFCVWSFKTHFNIIKQDGIYGIVTETAWHKHIENEAKAKAYDTIPEFAGYLYE